MVRVLLRWRSVDDHRAYAYGVAANLVVDEIRRSQSRRKTVERLRWESTVAVPAADFVVRDLVERLPRRLREPVLLHYYADLAVDEVARQLGKPPGTVRRWLVEARQLLRADLVEEDSR